MMKFQEKIDFILGNLENYPDPFETPSTAQIHEKTILKAKEIIYNNGSLYPFIYAHTPSGLVPALIEFPSSEINRFLYCEEIINMLYTFEATGYSVLLSGWSLEHNEHAQSDLFFNDRISEHPDKQETLQIMTEDNNNFRRTTKFKIIKKIIKGQGLSKLIMREDFEEMHGRLNGLLNRRL